MRNLLLTRTASAPFGGQARTNLVELKNSLRDFHQSERGDNENLGRMLVLALILVPIVIVLTVFGTEIVTKGKDIWQQVIGGAVTP
jgi:hypothetical protein